MVTIKIDERTKTGKILLEIVQIFSKDRDGVEIVDEEDQLIEKIPNDNTLKSMKKTSQGIGVTKCKDLEDLFTKLEI